MISGSIKLYEEPKPYQHHSSNNYSRWNNYYDDFTWNANDRTTLASYQEREKQYQIDLAEVHRQGITVGTRVKRKSDVPALGTVVLIHGCATAAYNFNLDEMEILKVEWDKGHPASQGTYDYNINDLVVVSTPGEPAL